MGALEQLQTGDIILFDTMSPFSNPINYLFDVVIKFITRSKYTHCGVVLKNPKFGNLPLGLYIWESGVEKTPDPQDNTFKLGVQICKLEDYKQNWNSETKPFVRRWSISSDERHKLFTDEKMNDLHQRVYDKPYDTNPIDWVSALLGMDKIKTTKRFWCSAFAGYVLLQLGLIYTADCSMLSPKDLSDKSQKIKYLYKLRNDEPLIW